MFGIFPPLEPLNRRSGEQPAHLCAGLLNQAFTSVRVDVHRRGDAGMAADLLDRLQIDVGLRQRRDVAVPEHVRRRALEIDLLRHLSEEPAEDHLRDGHCQRSGPV